MDQDGDRKGAEMRGGPWLRPYRVANFLDCTKRHVYDLVREGELEAIRLGPRDLRISENSVQKYMEKMRINSQDFDR